MNEGMYAGAGTMEREVKGPMPPVTAGGERYQAITAHNLHRSPIWERIPDDLREAIRVVSEVLPFRANSYVVEQLIDWSRVPDDPIYQLTFPHRGMLRPEDYRAVAERLAGGDRGELRRKVAAIRMSLDPHPGGQLQDNVPRLDGRRLEGIQHKYRETVLYFPSHGQTCHAYCSYCFRWAQFVGMPELSLSSREVADLTAYLGRHEEVSDLLLTGGDPLIMKTELLAKIVEPILDPALAHVSHLRIGSKALSFWPFRFLTDDDADDLLRLFERVVKAGRHLALMAHFSHPVELDTPAAREAIRRVRATGAEIRMQAPVVAHVNDRAEDWRDMCRTGVELGMVPYYMFVERDTGARNYFEIPLQKAFEVYSGALRQLSGLGRTLRGPVMSAHPGKVHILGTTRLPTERGEEDVFVLRYVQARNPDWVLRPFFARLDPRATWFDQLRPADPGSAPFFPHLAGDRAG